MTKTPEPTDKLDAATQVAVNGPADDPRNDKLTVRRHATDLDGLLEPCAGKLARPVPRGAWRRKAPGLPAKLASQADPRPGGGTGAPSYPRRARPRTAAHRGTSGHESGLLATEFPLSSRVL